MFIQYFIAITIEYLSEDNVLKEFDRHGQALSINGRKLYSIDGKAINNREEAQVVMAGDEQHSEFEVIFKRSDTSLQHPTKGREHQETGHPEIDHVIISPNLDIISAPKHIKCLEDSPFMVKDGKLDFDGQSVSDHPIVQWSARMLAQGTIKI